MKSQLKYLLSLLAFSGVLSCSVNNDSCDLTPKWVVLENDMSVNDFSMAILEEYQLPAVSIGVSDNGHNTYSTKGYWNSNSTQKVNDSIPMFIGSCSKTFTALLIALLVEEGYFSFQTTLPALLPDMYIHSDNEKITIHHLLTHTSGIEQYWTDEEVFSNSNTITTPTQSVSRVRSSFVSTLLKKPPQFKIGSYNYSNAGYAVLAEIIEMSLNQPYEAVIDSLLFTKYDLQSALFGYYNLDGASTLSRHQYRSSNCIGIPIKRGEREFPAILNSAGGISLNLRDFVKFTEILLEVFNSDSLNSTKQLFEVHFQNQDSVGIGYGLHCIYVDELLTYGHTGSDQTMRAAFALNPAKNKAAVFMTNIGDSISEMALVNVINELID
ncbi:MAG: serine hydrolase domain-containing protein [Allomuricauda sp.]|jgi:CubicO group peptidase (beta-lactamase class C family)